MRFIRVTKKANAGSGQAGSHGHVQLGSLTLPCAIGAAGIFHDKREGDNATPAGNWPIIGGFYRPDRGPRPRAWRLLQALTPAMGWCDDPTSASYNRLVSLPFSAGHELMWRNDGLYDIVIVLGHNLHPRRKNRGSAIFLHCAREGFPSTAGCVALRKADLLRLLPRFYEKMVLKVR